MSDVSLRFIKQRVGFHWGSSVAEEHGLGSVVPIPRQKRVGSAALGNLVCTVQMDTVPVNTSAHCLISYTGC